MRYEAPETLDAAVGLLANETGTTRILAGGTDLIVQMASGFIKPDLVVDIKRIKALHDITLEEGGYRIGAAVNGAELGEHEGLCALWPGVVEAVELIGSTQIQGRATLVGNLCNASPAADGVPALLTADALVRVVGKEGTRDIPVGEIAVSPGKNSLGVGELVHSVFLPARPPRASDAYLRFIPRTEMDIAVVGASVSLTLDTNGICTDARVALGAVAARALLVGKAANTVIGTSVDKTALKNLAKAASQAAQPISDKRGTVEFRTKVAGVMAKRAALIALGRAKENK